MKDQEFNEAEVQQILARAVHLDATAPERLRVDQVRAIAAELGVSQASVERAIEEYAAHRVSTPAQPATPMKLAPVRRRWFRRPLAVVAVILAMLLVWAFARRVVVEQPADQPSIDVTVPAP